MIQVVLIGTGNVAWHLFHAMRRSKEIELVQLFGRKRPEIGLFDASVPFTTSTGDLLDADVYVIAIADASIADFSKHLRHLKGLVVHTSGSTPLSALQCGHRTGVMYPVQTFTKGRPLPFNLVPLALETNRPDDQSLLLRLAKTLSDRVLFINSAQRATLHLSAVFANNFSNFMFVLAREIIANAGLEFDLLKPLILETADKIREMDPLLAQTGPARRHDENTLDKHLAALEGENREIYEILSRAIAERYPLNTN